MNKIFKTVLSLCILASVILMTACQQALPTAPNGAYFLENEGNISIIGNIDELNEYVVTFTKSTNTFAKDVQIDLTKEEVDGVSFNKYTTHLTNSKYNDEDCYLLETSLVYKVHYALYGESKGEFINTTTEKVYFRSVSNKLRPIYSEQSVLATSPIRSEDGKFSLSTLEYSVTTTYDNDSAVVNFSHTQGDFGIPDGERTYTKLNKSNYYFDNATLLFVPRTINLNDSANLTFTVIDAISGINRTLTMSSDQQTPNEKLIFSTTNTAEGVINHDYFINNHKDFIEDDSQVIPCQVVNFAISGTFSGAPIKCWYANTSLENARARLIKTQSSAPYSLGTFTTTIVKTTVTG